MKIEVLGTGCSKCNLLESTTRRVADRLGLEYTLEHVKDIRKITDYGVMMTPALAINGQVRVTGKVPSESELERLLTA
ncbi:MAG: TM0996/MTH895 family glutaredoxin-like protein [Phycisphaerae bacterium]|nr:TM0996/MTH895 family glutaredoxin-like protein [Phycisphaerae bacterium]